jgi:hypothetical protein
MLRRRTEQLKRFIGGVRGVGDSFPTEREGIELIREAQGFKLERGDNGHEDVLALGSHGSRGRRGQVGIGLQGFVKDFYLPLFLGSYRDLP